MPDLSLILNLDQQTPAALPVFAAERAELGTNPGLAAASNGTITLRSHV